MITSVPLPLAKVKPTFSLVAKSATEFTSDVKLGAVMKEVRMEM